MNINSSEAIITLNPTRSKEETNRNDAIVASLFIVTSVLGLAAYIPCIVAMCKAKELRSPCYTFMISLGISDCTSLVGWLVIGIHTASHGTMIPKIVLTILLAILVIGWGSLTIHEVMIAVNRYIAVCHPDKHDRLFSKKRMVMLLIVSYAYAVGVHASATFIPPFMEYGIDNYNAGWANKDVIMFYTYSEIICVTTVFVICIFSYTSVVVKYTRVKKQVAPNAGADKTKQAAKDKKEVMFQLRLTMQTSIRSLTFFIYDLLFFLVSFTTKDLWAVFICSTYFWCFNNAICPWIYLSFNSQMRKTLKGYVLGKYQDDSPT